MFFRQTFPESLIFRNHYHNLLPIHIFYDAYVSFHIPSLSALLLYLFRILFTHTF